MSDLEEQFRQQLEEAGLPKPVEQFRFYEGRAFKADFAWPSRGVLVEIQGGGSRGRHQRTPGYDKDRLKMALAQLLGYWVLEFTSSHVKKGIAIRVTKAALENKIADELMFTEKKLKRRKQ